MNRSILTPPAVPFQSRLTRRTARRTLWQQCANDSDSMVMRYLPSSPPHARTHTRQVRRRDPRTIRTAGIPACSPIKLSYLCTRLLVIWRRECGRWYVCQQSVSTRRQRQSMDVADSRYYSHQYECIFVVRAERAMLLSSRLLGHAFVPLSTGSWRLLTLIFCMFVKEYAEVTWRITFVMRIDWVADEWTNQKVCFFCNLGQILFHTGWLKGSWHFYFGKML